MCVERFSAKDHGDPTVKAVAPIQILSKITTSGWVPVHPQPWKPGAESQPCPVSEYQYTP